LLIGAIEVGAVLLVFPAEVPARTRSFLR
jgi:hypothetical protein